MKNLRIAIYNNKPFYISQNDTIDYWLLMKALFVIVTSKTLDSKDFDEYQSKHTIKGNIVADILKQHNVLIWKWSELNNDWIKIP